MMVSQNEALSSFIASAPPGELSNVTASIKSILGNNASALGSLRPAFQQHNEEQLWTVKLPGGSEKVVVSAYNSLEDGRYFDVGSKSSFAFDHVTQEASAVQSYVLESSHSDLVNSLLKSLSSHTSEHFPSSSFGVYPTKNDSKIAIVIVANKYSPSNFWNGRWRSQYLFDPSSGSLTGAIKVDVHYYEDGNVRLLTDKAIDVSVSGSGNASEIARQISTAERGYQEELNKSFANLSEGAFKGLRRQLPVTRQKVEWEKISGYRVGQDIGGGRSK